MRILLVDDDPQANELLGNFLRHHGHEVIFTTDGMEGFSAALVEQPDACLVDLHMPKMSGTAVTHMIKSLEATKNIPVIIYTGCIQRESEKYRYESIFAGAVDVWQSVGDPMDMKERLEMVLAMEVPHKDVPDDGSSSHSNGAKQ
jgi:DNA-binding response OmpR family regulator